MRKFWVALSVWLVSIGCLASSLWDIESPRDSRLTAASWGFCTGVWMCMAGAAFINWCDNDTEPDNPFDSPVE